MKKIYLIGVFIIFAVAAMAQTGAKKDSVEKTAAANKQLVRTAASLKSGNSQDVLASFFKLGYNDLTTGHQFQFNSSLFAIKAKTDTTLWIDTNYRKQVFARNFVFGVNMALDSNNKFKSSTISLKYALINNRDKDLFNYPYGKKLYDLMYISNKVMGIAASAYLISRGNDPKARKLIVNYFSFNKKADETKLQDLPQGFIGVLDSVIKANNVKSFNASNIQAVRDSISDMYTTAAGLMAQQSLWTIGSNISTDPKTVFNKVNFNSEYLKGITRNNTTMGLELDIKADLNIYDTTSVNTTYHRSCFFGTAGVNWIIYKDKKSQKSYIEFKPALAYSNVLSGLLPSEKKSQFTGDGILRFRITDDLWIPVEIKYDPVSGKVLGLLNITANFDWLGSKSAKN